MTHAIEASLDCLFKIAVADCNNKEVTLRHGRYEGRKGVVKEVFMSGTALRFCVDVYAKNSKKFLKGVDYSTYGFYDLEFESHTSGPTERFLHT